MVKMLRTRDLCERAVSQFIELGVVPPFVVSGELRDPMHLQESLSRAQQERIHYSELFGPLYSDSNKWRFVFDLVQSFVRNKPCQTSLEMPDMFGVIGVSVEDLLPQLPSVFAHHGFSCIDRNEITKSATFVSKENCEVKYLPEPFGKWLQQQNGQIKWSQNEDLEVHIHLRAEPSSRDSCLLHSESSAWTQPLWGPVADRLNHIFHLSHHPIVFSQKSFRARAHFALAGKPVVISDLPLCKTVSGLFRGQTRLLPKIEGVINSTEYCAYFRFFDDYSVLHTIGSPDWLSVEAKIYPGTTLQPLGLGTYSLDGTKIRFCIGSGQRQIRYEGRLEDEFMRLESRHLTTNSKDVDLLSRVTHQ